MLTIQLQAADAVAIASLIAAATGNADNPEVLNQVWLTVDGSGEIMATATNRFMIATYSATATATDATETVELGITAKAAKFIIANVKRGNKWTTPEAVELIANPATRELSIRHGAAVYGDVWPGAKYPPVASLLTEWTAATNAQPVKLRTAWLGVLGKLLDGFTKVDFWLYELGGDKSGRERPGPVRATAGNFTALIQPNLIK